MKRSAENWLAEIKLERQARRIARNVVTTLVAKSDRPHGKIRIAEDSWLTKIRNVLRNGFSHR